MLDPKCKFINDMLMSQGSVNSSIMPVREVYIQALKKMQILSGS